MKPRVERDAVFGLLTIVDGPVRKGRRLYWNCRCLCGKSKQIREDHLRSGASTSCGCQWSSAHNKTHTTHGYAKRGEARRREYHSWADAKKRCFNPKATAYADYGGRGVIMCEAWRLSFEAFLADMGTCPDGFTLERENNNGNYEPGNCLWTSREKQARNRRSSISVEFDGETMPLIECAARLSLPYKALHYQLRQRGFTLLTAIENVRSRHASE